MDDEFKPKRGMVVVAHPDDAEWGCSGTVARWCKEGMEVFYVICTDGSKGSDDSAITSEKLAEIRKKEQQSAAKMLGVKQVVFLGYEDAMLTPSLALRKDITRELRRFKPDIVIAPYPTRELNEREYIGHPDHIAVGEAALSAIFPAARDRLTFPELIEEGFQPHKVGQLLVGDRSPGADTWIDVTDTIDVAIQALQQHKSQVTLEVANHNMRLWRSETGKLKNMIYAESFKGFRFRQ